MYKPIKSYKMKSLTSDQKKFLDQCVEGTWKFNSFQGVVDVKGSFDCSNMGLENFKGIRFGTITGYFDCSQNNLTSLEGAPEMVGKNSRGCLESFDCSYNNLTTLEGGPRLVENYDCSHNNLISLSGAPLILGFYRGQFDCSYNNLTSLEVPEEREYNVSNFDSFINPYTKELGWYNHKNVWISNPREQDLFRFYSFNCSNNKLTSLKGAPIYVDSYFDCSNNNLSNLEGFPLSGNYLEFDCSTNKIVSLKGCDRDRCKRVSEIKLKGNSVSENTLILIFKRMKLKKENYKESVEYLWNEIPEIDQNKLDRPEKFTLETFIKDMKMEDEKMWNLQKEIDEIEAKKKKLVEEIRQCEKRKQQVQLNMKQKFKDSEKRLGRL